MYGELSLPLQATKTQKPFLKRIHIVKLAQSWQKSSCGAARLGRGLAVCNLSEYPAFLRKFLLQVNSRVETFPIFKLLKTNLKTFAPSTLQIFPKTYTESEILQLQAHSQFATRKLSEQWAPIFSMPHIPLHFEVSFYAAQHTIGNIDPALSNCLQQSIERIQSPVQHKKKRID